MTKKRPSYSTEFNNEAASLVLDKNYAIAETCHAMGVGYTAKKIIQYFRPGLDIILTQVNTAYGGIR